MPGFFAPCLSVFEMNAEFYEHYYDLRKHEKTFGFLMFSRCNVMLVKLGFHSSTEKQGTENLCIQIYLTKFQKHKIF